MKRNILKNTVRVLLAGLLIILLSACGSGGGGGGEGGGEGDSGADSGGAGTISTQWATSIVDNSSMRAGFNASIAIDADDNIHVVHIDDAHDDLKYTTNISGKWESSTIDNCTFTYLLNYEGKGYYRLSIVTDSNNDAHVTYECDGSVKYATNSSGAWVSALIDAGLNPLIAIGSGENMHISYMNRFNIAYNLVESKYATNMSGDWESTTVRASGGTPAIIIDSQGSIHLFLMGISNDTLYVNEAANTAGTWVWEERTFSINGSEMRDMAVKMDSEDNLHVAYIDTEDKSLRYATNRTGIWSSMIIDGCRNSDFPYCEGPRRPSIAVDSEDNAHISYYFNDRGSGSLKYASITSGSSVTEIIDDYLDMGQYPSIAVDSADNVHISYMGEYNMYNKYLYLKYATNRPPAYDATGSWSYKTSNNWVSGSGGCTGDSDETGAGNIIQDGKLLAGEFQDIAFTGRASGTVYELSTSFPEDGGITRILIYLTMTSESSASGRILWFWNGSGYCEGGSNIDINRM